MTGAPVGVVTGPEIPGPNLALLASMPRVDLMPPEMAERDALRRLQMGCVAAVVACAVAVGSLWFQAHSTVDDAKKNLATTQAEQQNVNRQVAQLSSVSASFAALERANQLVQQALGGEVRWSGQLRDLSMTIPANVYLTNMSVAAGTSGAVSETAGATSTTGSSTASTSNPATPGTIATITFQGTAASRYDVANWLNKIATMKGYVNATYSTSTERVINGVIWIDFNSTIQVTTDALSGRYAKPAGS